MKTWRIPTPEPRERLWRSSEQGAPDLYRLDFEEWFYIVIDAAGPHIVRPAVADSDSRGASASRGRVVGELALR